MLHSVLLLLLAPDGQTVEWAQLSIQQRIIIRVPMDRRKGRASTREREDPVEWEEKKGPKCLAIRSIRAAAITVPNGVDLVLADNHRYRARLERGCRSAGFYSGFYVEPERDGSLCAGRDDLQARSGFACAIDSFKRLVEGD
ncbi:hypothetical protein WG908_10500 [Sphingobium sp. AN641]|uniref:hypothetical protein n=1 Tax=Sphingobium sp. AN641 TaxID=3133443 RepID=UPI0030BDA74C